MAPPARLRDRLNRALRRRFGLVLRGEAALYPWQVEPPASPERREEDLPPGAREALRPDHPDLQALARRYAAFDPRVTAPAVWTESRIPPEDMLWFRADNAYVWQLRGRDRNPLGYALCYYQLKADDREGLLDRFDEDRAFGVAGFEIDGRFVTRDLIDSVREVQFLIRHLGIDQGAWNLIDIGAGYGRLAWRLEQIGNEGLEVHATDGFATSTYVCGHYLRHRGARRARAVPLDEVEALLAATKIDVAVNVHSFSECTVKAVDWWVSLIARHEVRHLMVVPNAGTSGGARCETNAGEDLEPVFARHGYRPVAREPRYPDPLVQAHGIDPIWLHLFRLDDGG
jgi:hypothetical protein